jgi:phage terminase Nu1 subunit (DNA packaging protein)
MNWEVGQMLINDLSYTLKTRKEEIKKWVKQGCPVDTVIVEGKLQYEFDLRELQIWRYRRGMRG